MIAYKSELFDAKEVGVAVATSVECTGGKSTKVPPVLLYI
jgi:hypothetical protein